MSGRALFVAWCGMCVGVLVGTWGERRHNAVCQEECAHGSEAWVCAPRLKDGKDYCVPVAGAR
jgi:hypothetical protein